MAKLLSVNVGLPREIPWRGKIVYTSVWKEPVLGRRLVRQRNVDGDAQGDLKGHGGEHRAVFVYQMDSYHFWERELKRDDFTFGQFGENFTVEGLADSEVCIGDRYRIGGALFEVTQPRVTCYRIGIRMIEPRMPALLVAHRRPGFYLRVIEEGEVGAGDEIVKVADGPEHLTVATADALLYLRGPAREDLERALRIPALSPGWKSSFEARLRHAAEPELRTGNAGLISPEQVLDSGKSIMPGVKNAPHHQPHAPAGEPGEGPKISFVRTGLTVSWDPKFQSLLELAEACDVPVRWSCRTGVCHTCECRLISGSVKYNPEPLEPPAAGNLLICCSRPQDDMVIDI